MKAGPPDTEHGEAQPPFILRECSGRCSHPPQAESPTHWGFLWWGNSLVLQLPLIKAGELPPEGLAWSGSWRQAGAMITHSIWVWREDRAPRSPEELWMAASRSGRSGNITLHNGCILGGEAPTPKVLRRTSLQQSPLLPHPMQREGKRCGTAQRGRGGKARASSCHRQCDAPSVASKAT